MVDVRDIVIKYLKENEYDGLVCGSCSCRIDDLMPCCSYDCAWCRPGKLINCRTCRKCDGKLDWCMEEA